MLAKHALYQLSYGPKGAWLVANCWSRPGVTWNVVGPGRLELPTSRLSGVCSNQLSYRPGIALRPGAPDPKIKASQARDRAPT